MNDLNRQFTKEGIQKANGYDKTCSISPIKLVQIKPRLRCHYSLKIIDKMKNTENASVGEDVVQLKSHAVLVKI